MVPRRNRDRVFWPNASKRYIPRAKSTLTDYLKRFSSSVVGQMCTALAEAPAELPTEFGLEANYPNPFNPSTTIRFSLPESAQVRLVVLDVLGRQIRVLLDGTRQAGAYEVLFDANDLPSGMYLYRLETPQGSFVRTMLLAK